MRLWKRDNVLIYFSAAVNTSEVVEMRHYFI